MKKKILFIGGINLGQRPKGGEEYKNQLLVEKFTEDFATSIIDTYQWKKNPLVIFKIIFHSFFVSYDSIVLSASSYSTYRLIQFYNLFPSLLKKTHYFVIGGFFPLGLQQKIFNYKKYINLKSIVVEGKSLKQQIIEVCPNFTNLKVINNFKKFDLSIIDKLQKKKNETSFRFVFISRISESKGIFLIHEAYQTLKIQIQTPFSIDFYGIIDKEVEDTFKNILDENFRYQGFLDFQNDSLNSYQTLADYDVMLFPTFWKGEGFPGVIVDAFIAGLPVIASDWNMNSELIEEEKNGWLLKEISAECLAEKMKKVMNYDKEYLFNLSKEIQRTAPHYHLENTWLEFKTLFD